MSLMRDPGYMPLRRYIVQPKKHTADIFLWRDKKIASVLGFATSLWVLFELLQYHLLTLVCHILILALAVLFLWSNASTFINNLCSYMAKTPQIVGIPRVPESWNYELSWATTYATDKSSRVEVYRMILAATIYRLWRERNMRVFQQQQKPVELLTKLIIREVHARGSRHAKLASWLETRNFYPT